MHRDIPQTPPTVMKEAMAQEEAGEAYSLPAWETAVTAALMAERAVFQIQIQLKVMQQTVQTEQRE